MDDFSIVFPDYFDSYDCELEAKGCFGDIVVETGGQKFRIIFYDMARLSQDVGDELAINPAFLEKNLVIVPRITRAAIERAVQFLAASNGFSQLKPEV